MKNALSSILKPKPTIPVLLIGFLSPVLLSIVAFPINASPINGRNQSSTEQQALECNTLQYLKKRRDRLQNQAVLDVIN